MIIQTPSSNEVEQLMIDYNLTRLELAEMAGYTYNTLCLIMRDKPGYAFCPVRFGLVKHFLSESEEYLHDTLETIIKNKGMKIDLIV
jgi:hypothetical protein